MSLENLNRFVKNPTNLDISRSRFPRNHTHKTTFKSGDLVPIYLDEVVPGDTFDVDISSVVRMLTPAVPVMDICYLDTYFFFVPSRICCNDSKDWASIMGENTGGYWAQSSEKTLENTGNTHHPRTVKKGSVANYLGLPIGNIPYGAMQISDLPFRAYALIWNEFFRDQNTQPPVSITNPFDSLDTLYEECFKVNKLHDYFTSALPSPQKGEPVLLPIGGVAPVNAYVTQHSVEQSLHFRYSNNEQIPNDNIFSHDLTIGRVSAGSSGQGYSYLANVSPHDSVQSVSVTPDNLWADLSQATAASVNQIRQAFAIQRLLEKDARGGTRYREMLKSHFGVTIPDLTIQVPEYLGGKRVPLNITQVLQTSETTDVSPLGATGAFSNTSFVDKSFIKSFNEFGYIIGVCCVRAEQSYSQGLSKLWTRNRRYDWYFPAFANLGEQPIYARELYLAGMANETAYNGVFGYQEAWAEYRYHPNLVTGNLAPGANDNTMTAWTYTNKFTAIPVLNSDFMVQPSSQIGNTLVVPDTITQFVADFFFKVKCTRPMPVYSIPGLIDHH